MSKDKQELFEEARQESIKAVIMKTEESETGLTEAQKETTLKIMKERIAEGETQWDLLKRMIDGSMTEKFIGIIDNMPDRDFVRNYLKLLEHFKPKLVRGEEDSTGREDTTINIQAVILNKAGEHEVIELNQYKQKRNGNEVPDA